MRSALAARTPRRPPQGAALPVALLLLAIACWIPTARADISHIALTGVDQIELGDLDGNGQLELVAVTEQPSTIHVFTRSGLGWVETGNYPIAGIDLVSGMQNFQLVPRNGTSGPLDIILMQTEYYPSLRSTIVGLRNHGDGTFDPLQVLGPTLDYQPPLPGSVVNLTTAQGPGMKFVLAAPRGGQNQGDIHYVPMPFSPGSGAVTEVQTNTFFFDQMVTRDLNGDGKPDQLAMGLSPTSPNSWSIQGEYRAGGTGGTFGAWQVVGGGGDGRSPLHVEDVDGDGDLDVVATYGSHYGSFVTLLPGQGAAGPGPAYSVGSYSGAAVLMAVVGDLNEDGRPDLVSLYSLPVDPYTSSDITEAGFIVQLNDHDQPPYFPDETRHPVWTTPLDTDWPFAVRVGELSGDTHLDVAFVSPDGITIFPGLGDGTFETAGTARQTTIVSLGDDPTRTLALADLDGSGGQDILIGSDGTTGTSLRRVANTGGGTFAVTDVLDTGGPVDLLAVADLFSNGTPDVIMAGGEEVGFSSWAAGLGPWNWAMELDNGSGSGNAHGLAVRDLGGNGVPDLMLLSSGVSGEHYEVLGDDGHGNWLAPQLVPYGPSDASTGLMFGPPVPGVSNVALTMSVANHELRGIDNPTAGGWYTSHFEVGGLLATAPAGSPHPFDIGQFSGTSGPYTLVAANTSGDFVELRRSPNPADDTWHYDQQIATVGTPWAVAIGDLDNQNGPDIAIACHSPSGITIAHNDGAGGFTTESFAVPDVADVRIGDVNGDGKNELVFLTSSLTLPGPAGAAAPRARAGLAAAAGASALGVTTFPSVTTTSVPGSPAPSGTGAIAFSIRPNPATGPLTVRFTMPAAGRVTLELLDLSGRRVSALADRTVQAGAREWALDSSQGLGPLAAGVYFARIVTPFGSETRRVVHMR